MRKKIRQEQSNCLSRYAAMDFDPLHTLAAQSSASRYSNSNCVLRQIEFNCSGQDNTLAYVNRLLESLASGDKQKYLTPSLRWRLRKRGAAVAAALSDEINLSDLVRRCRLAVEGFHFTRGLCGDSKKQKAKG